MTMVGYKCRNCRYESITPAIFCPQCSKQQFEEVNVPDQGEVYSFTTIRVPPPEFASIAPYQVALVQLTEKLQVTAFIKEAVQIGDCVKLKEIKNKAFIFEPIFR